MEFREFGLVDWATWTVQLLLGHEVEPSLPASRESDPRLRLIPFANTLDSTSSLRFREGLALALESTPPRQENARVLYYLLDLVSYFTPVGGKLVVRQLLFSGTLWDCSYKADTSQVEANLQTSALSACGAYSIDEPMAGFMKRTLNRSSDYRYILTCFRLLSRFRERPPVELLHNAVQMVRTRVDAEKIVRELLKSAKRYGFSDVMSWYREHKRALVVPPDRRWELFSEAWRMLAPKWEVAGTSEDPAEQLLALASNPEGASLTADNVLSVAKLGKVVDPTNVAFTLAVLTRRHAEVISYFDPRDAMYSSMVREPEKVPAILKVGRNGPVTPVPSELRYIFEMSERYNM